MNKGAPYDAKFIVAEIGAVNMGEIGAGSVIFFGVRISLGTSLGRFSIIYFGGLGLRLRVRDLTRVRVLVRDLTRVPWSRNTSGLGSQTLGLG